MGSAAPARDWRTRLRDWRTVFLPNRLARAWSVLTLPAAVLYLLWSHRIDPAYRLNWLRRVRLGWRMWKTTRGVWTGTSYKAHLAMAVKLLEIPPEVEGVVVECGCYVGGSSANLSLACEAAGRELIVYDSFEGLPPPTGNDQYAARRRPASCAATSSVVKANVTPIRPRSSAAPFARGGSARRCREHREPVVLAFLDVDYQASLDDCIRNLWPHLTERGYAVHRRVHLHRATAPLFWSERYWRETFDAAARPA